MLSWAHLLHGFCSEFYIKRKKTCLVSVSHYLLQLFQLILQLFCLMLLLPIQRTQTVHLMAHTVERFSWFCWAPWHQWGSTEVERMEKMDTMISLEEPSWVFLVWFVFWFGFGCFGFFGWTFFSLFICSTCHYHSQQGTYTDAKFSRCDFESIHKQKLLLGLIRLLNFSLKKTEMKKPYGELPWDFIRKKKASLKNKCLSAEVAGGCITAVYVTANFLLNYINVLEALKQCYLPLPNSPELFLR